MARIYGRPTWTTTPKGFTRISSRRLNPNNIVRLVPHYPAMGNVTVGPNPSLASSCQRLRGWRNLHVNTNGWADLGYPYAIDQAGRIFDCAGDTHAAAHTIGWNFKALAVLFIVGNNERPTPAARAAFRALGRHLRKKFRNMSTVPRDHGRMSGNSTACAGQPIRRDIDRGELNFGGTGSTPATGGSSGGSSSSGASGVTGRFLRVTAKTRANLRSGPGENHSVIGTADRGALLRRNPARDTNGWYGVGDRWFIGSSVASPVRAEASNALVIGDWPGRQMPINGSNTFELNRGWQELLARIDIRKGNRTSMWQRWLRDRGFNPGPIDGIEGPLTISALQRYLNANAPRPGSVRALVVDGKRGDLTRASEKRFLNSQIQHLGSKYPQEYRHTG